MLNRPIRYIKFLQCEYLWFCIYLVLTTSKRIREEITGFHSFLRFLILTPEVVPGKAGLVLTAKESISWVAGYKYAGENTPNFYCKVKTLQFN
jgi:hypothetical protein